MKSLSRAYTHRILKKYVDSWPQKDLIFSYKINCSGSSLGTTLSLQQKQTDFSILMTIKSSGDDLEISSFTLIKEPCLEEVSPALAGAAVNEIFLQGLNLLLFTAQRLNKKDLRFILPFNETPYFYAFGDIFDFRTIATCLEKDIKTFLLSVLPPNANEIFSVLEKVKKTVYQTLWAEQPSDLLVRQYLQSPDRLTTYHLSNLLRQKKEDLAEEWGKVIPWPLLSKSISSLQT